MKKILVISPTYGNNKLADAIQNQRLFAALSRYYELSIICKNNIESTNHKIIQISSPNLYLLDRLLWKLFPPLIQVFSISEFLWIIKCYKYISKNHYFDYLLCTYQPNYVHLLVSRVSKYFSSVVSIFYDPCAPNMFLSQTHWALILRDKIERNIAEFSSVIALNNKMYFDYCYERYNDITSVINLPMCMPNKKLDERISPAPDNKKHIIFAGNIYGQRKLDLLIQTLQELKSKNKDFENVAIDFYGSCVREEKEKVFNSAISKYINFYGFIPYDELELKYNSADAFLLIEPTNGCNYSFPSKVLEYLSYSKPIFIYASKNNAVRELERKGSIYIADKDSLDIIKNGVKELLNVTSKQIIQRDIHEYLPDNIAEKLFLAIENK